MGKVAGDALQLNDLFPINGYHSTWESPEAFSRYIKSLDKTQAWSQDAWDSGSEGFYGATMAEALTMSEKGWAEGGDMLDRISKKINADHPVGPRLIKFGIAGAIPDVPRAVSGNILNMRDVDTGRAKKRPVLTLICNMCSNCGVNKDWITNRAATLAALIDKIEAAGFACEVISTAYTKGYTGDGFEAATSVIVKASNQPVDPPRLAFGAGHVAMFRRMMFADWEYEPLCRNGLGSGLGSAQNLPIKEGYKDKNIYVLPATNSKFATEESSSKEGLPFLIDTLRKQGCPAFPKWDPGKVEEETPAPPSIFKF